MIEKYNGIIFYSVVVIYNTSVNESITINNLKKITSHNISIIVIDNSTEDVNNEIECKKNEWRYISMDGNKGLSKAYNKALELLNEKDGIVVWFDDDSDVTQEYFDALELAVTEYDDTEIFVPIIKGQDGKFWSPNEFRILKNKQLTSTTDTIQSERFNAINSCMAVRLSVYKDYRYDERLFLDQVDHKFCEDQRLLGRRFKKLDVVIQHNFSTKEDKKSLEQLTKRYSIMIPDYLYYASKTKFRLFLGYIKVIGWGIRESVKNNEPFFFFWCLYTIIKKHNY